AQPAAAVPAATPPAGATPTAVPAQRHMSLGDLLGLAFLAFIAVIATLNGVRSCRAGHRMDPLQVPALQAHVAEYVNIPGLNASPVAGPLNGKAVVVDTVNKTLHPLQRGLPAGRAAQRPEDVGIVVWVTAERAHEGDLVPGTYVMPTGIAAEARYEFVPAATTGAAHVAIYRSLWTVTVIDWPAKQVRYRSAFRGADPPSAAVSFKSNILTGQLSVYQLNDEQQGVEVLQGSEGGLELSGGQRITGLVGAPPWDEAVQWLAEVMG
ncbi:MAG: hypothetical protein ACUVX9_13330, partial [Anaerolineae bacterium]